MNEPPAKKHKPEIGSNEIQNQRTSLPIFYMRKALLKKVRSSASLILLGETACGKTTQIPQYLYEDGLHKNRTIACTQPRRVAAITVAQRVAQETNSKLGELVGYCVRFDDTTSAQTKLKYMTDGMLLREAITDPLLKRYSIVILDEAHERSIQTDVLFGIVKAAQRKRKEREMLPLKIIIMSATMDVDHFSKYFNDAPVLYISGRQYPVQLFYAPEPQNDYLFSSLVTIFQIHQEEPPEGDILVFLTGQEEIEATVRAIKDIALTMPSTCAAIYPCPMYANMPAGQQLKIFRPTLEGSRKVIVSTNIAETSVTIRGVKYVIDSGKVKAKSYHPKSGLDLLKVQRISQNQAWQRTGRAGREAPGVCYRLYTEAKFQSWPQNTTPDIQRCNMASVVLQLMALGVPDVCEFDFMDRPSEEHLNNAFHQLILLGAVTEDRKTLTPLGRQMAAFPLDPKLSKVILTAKDNGCLEEILTVVSLISTDNLLYNSPDKREEAVAVRKKFSSSEGDHMTMLNMYRSYRGVNGNKAWCQDNFINAKGMVQVMDIRKQLKGIAQRLNLTFASCGRDTAAIRKCLVSGFFMDSAELQTGGVYTLLNTRKPVAIHPSSSLFMSKPEYVIYNELTETTKCYMKDLCVVDAEWLYEANPTFFRGKLGR